MCAADTSETYEALLSALRTIRAPVGRIEYDIHTLVLHALQVYDIPFEHEKTIGPRCRIDFVCGSVGIEVKRGVQNKQRLLSQLERYAASDMINGLILVTEKTVTIPHTLHGKPLYQVCLNKLWGIAL